MANVVVRGNAAVPPPAVIAQDKATRNKRKFRPEPPVGDAAGPLALPFTPDGISFDLSLAEKAVSESCGSITSSSSINLEHLEVCDMCKPFVCVAGPSGTAHEEGAVEWEGFQDMDWSEFTETQLEEILMGNLDVIFGNAIKSVVLSGYSEEVAKGAVASAGMRCGWKENLYGIAENALGLLKRGGGEVDSLPKEESEVAEELNKVKKSMIVGMVGAVTEAQPFFSSGDAMWCLLISDLDVARACSVDYDPCNGSVGGEVIAVPHAVHQAELGLSSSTVAVSPVGPESSGSIREKLTTVLPASRNRQADLAKMLGIPNLPNGKSSVTGNMQCVISTLKTKDHPVASGDHIEETFMTGSIQSLKDEKPITSKRTTLGGSKKEAVLRQKSITLEKSFRALGSKATLRACKHGSLGTAVLDRKCKSISDSGMSLKGTSKVGKVFTASVTRSEVSLDLSFSAGLSGPSLDVKPSSKPPSLPATSTELSLSLPATGKSSAASATQEYKNVEPPVSNVCTNIFSYDNIGKDWVPQDKKDELAMKLYPRKKELEVQMQGWTDWALDKVMQAARRLAKDKEELLSLRQEKDEVGRLQDERRNLEESTRKKVLELESAISKASGQVEKTNAAARTLELENARLRLELEAAKQQAAESAATCQQLSRKEENSSKNVQSWELQRTLLQEELAMEKNKLSRLQHQIQQVKEHQVQVQARWKQEENLKNEVLARVNAERKEREQVETSARSQENALLLKAGNDMQRYKNEVRGLEQQIAQLKLLADSSKSVAACRAADRSYASRLAEGRKNNNAQVMAKAMVPQDPEFDDVQRERECVMCLSEEMSVVFLPCAHQVVCAKCNDLHEKQGMKDCPSCRTPIQRRIIARSAYS